MWGVADVIGGLLLVFNFASIIHTLLFYMGVILLVKGLWTVFESWRKKIYFDLSDWVDAFSGTIMLLVFFGVYPSFAWVLGAIVIIKGLWSMLSAM